LRDAGGNRTHFNCFAGSRLAIWLQRQCARRERRAFGLLVSNSSDPGSRHQKRPDLRQHFLKRRPLLHGQRSLRPSFSSSSLSPLTIRTPRLTCVSDGKPFRRLLIVSKKTAVRRSCVWTWDTSIRDADRKNAKSVLARNRTWSSTFAESRAYPAHSEDMLLSLSTPPGNRTPSCGSEDRRASITLARHD
jgi:hypothetical protein